ncbi:MAG: RidA family protein [Chloroflexi bacterium]|nr:RidA family protein [Chloroflexota bacterium]
MSTKRVYVDGLARLPAFSHAVVAGDFIFVSGCIGTKAGGMELVEGGTGAQTTQTLRNIEQILQASGATLADVVKVNVYLTEIGDFAEMNGAYIAVMGEDPPARITVGKVGFGLAAATVEIDCIAYKSQGNN